MDVLLKAADTPPADTDVPPLDTNMHSADTDMLTATPHVPLTTPARHLVLLTHCMTLMDHRRRAPNVAHLSVNSHFPLQSISLLPLVRPVRLPARAMPSQPLSRVSHASLPSLMRSRMFCTFRRIYQASAGGCRYAICYSKSSLTGTTFFHRAWLSWSSLLY